MDPAAEPFVFLFELVVASICTLGGFRFRRWAVEGRERVPRFSYTLETIICWCIYSVVVAFFVFWGRNSIFAYQNLGVG